MSACRIVAGTVLAACSAAFAAEPAPFSEPYAQVEAGDRSEVREEFPAAITQIDGKSTRNPRRPDPVPPGKHAVTVRYETGRVAQSPAETSRVLQMELEPCTRYRIVARRVRSTQWEPKVYAEPISECLRKFKKAG